jgi:hypothetical protein
MVVRILVRKRQDVQLEGAAPVHLARPQAGNRKPGGQLRDQPAFRHQAGDGVRVGRPGVEQGGERRIFVGEQGDAQFICLRRVQPETAPECGGPGTHKGSAALARPASASRPPVAGV